MTCWRAIGAGRSKIGVFAVSSRRSGKYSLQMPSAFDSGDPTLESGAQLGEIIMLGRGILDDGIADHGTIGRDRYRKGVAGPAQLWLLAAFGRSEAGSAMPFRSRSHPTAR